MFESLLDYFQGSEFSLWGPFLILLVCGIGIPIPEDIVLITAGALGEIDGRPWYNVAALMYVGVLGGDSMIFLAGRYFGARVLASAWFQRIFPPTKQAKVEQLFNRYGAAGLFFGRFLPGLRAPIYFSAGSMKVSFWKFVSLDGLAALISVPVFVWLGHWLWWRFGDDIEELNRALKRTHSFTLGFTVAIVLGVIITVVWMWTRRPRKAA